MINHKDYNHNSILLRKKRRIFLVILILLFTTGSIIARYYINIDKKYYNSLQELAENYYPNENIVYLQEGNYCYIIADSENITSERFIYKTPEGKYVVFRDLVMERFNRKRYFRESFFELENFYSFVHVEIHDSNCIILLDRFFVNDERVDIKVYDNFGQFKPNETYSREYYITILDINAIEEDYEVRVDIGEDSYYVVGAKEIARAK